MKVQVTGLLHVQNLFCNQNDTLFYTYLHHTCQPNQQASQPAQHKLAAFASGNLVGTLFHREAAQKFKQEWLRSQKEEAMEPQAQAESTGPRDMALKARTASRALQNLSSKQRERLLHKIAENLIAKEDEIMQENEKDCQVLLLLLDIDI